MTGSISANTMEHETMTGSINAKGDSVVSKAHGANP